MSSSNSTASMDGFVPELGISPASIAIPLLSLITILLDFPAVVWHIKNRNLPASSLIFWIIVSNLMNVINAILWPNDNIPSWFSGTILCDIEVKLDLAVTFALVGSVFCITRALARALDTSKPAISACGQQRFQRNLLDCALCFGPPLYIIIIHYVVQPSRYYLFAISGCTPSVDNSWPTIVLVFIWPPILCLPSAYYAVLTIHRLRKYRRDFAAILASSTSGLTRSRFLRLFVVAFIVVAIILPVQSYILYTNAMFPQIPYSWAAIHDPAAWNEIVMVPTAGAVAFDRWIRIALGIVVFVCFGTGKDAMRMYKAWLCTLGLGRMFPSLKRACSLPMHNHCASTRRSSASGFSTLKGKAASLFSSTFSRSSISSSTVSPNDPSKSFPRMPSVAEVHPSSPSTASSITHADLQAEKGVLDPQHHAHDRPVAKETPWTWFHDLPLKHTNPRAKKAVLDAEASAHDRPVAKEDPWTWFHTLPLIGHPHPQQPRQDTESGSAAAVVVR
ncbi:a-factor receptor [Xylographa trunciseda]|nr:a-factor receptor [Xylographa trunciseda]